MRPVVFGLAFAGVSLFGLGASQSVMLAPVTSAFTTNAHTLDNKLRGELEQIVANAAANELIPISIVLNHRADAQAIALAQQIEPKQLRREAVIDILKDAAAQSQGPLLDVLRDAQTQGKVGEHVRSLWIANVIGTSATPDVIRALAQRADVAYINWDRSVGEEVFPVMPPNLLNNAGGGTDGNVECGTELMGAPQVWNDFGITGENVVVGIIDTGCCVTHPDLVNQIWQNPGEIPGNGIDDDNNGFIDDINGWNHWQNNSDISDGNGHGTHTAGTVCGDGTNGITTGMAPDCQMMILKFWNNFGGESVVWACHEYAVENGADVITASIGWPHSVGPDRAMWREVCENSMTAGVVVVYAAGNEGGGNAPDNVRTPGDVPDMITAGATDCNDNIASFSSRGPVTWQNIPPYNDWPFPPGKLKPTVSAPGVNTTSTSNNCSGYRDLSGTSMATPHIAGAIALILDANPNLDHWDVKQLLKDTAVDRGAQGPDNDYGHGRVNAYAAVEDALSSSGTPANLESVEVLVGSPLGGGVAELIDSDDQYFSGRSGFGSTLTEAHLLAVQVVASTDATSPTTVDLSVEARHNDPGGLCQVRALNHNTGNFEFVGSFAVGTADTPATFPGLDASRYVDSNGMIVVQLRSVIAVPFLAYQFDGFYDQVHLLVNN